MPKHTPLTIEELRSLINKGECSDPLVFLEAVVQGQDPRRLSSIYELIMEIDSFSDGEPSSSDWTEVVDHVIGRFKYQTVSLTESTAAAKTLAEYLHSKKKSVEISGHGQAGSSTASNPLTEEEIELFREKFNEQF